MLVLYVGEKIWLLPVLQYGLLRGTYMHDDYMYLLKPPFMLKLAYCDLMNLCTLTLICNFLLRPNNKYLINVCVACFPLHLPVSF